MDVVHSHRVAITAVVVAAGASLAAHAYILRCVEALYDGRFPPDLWAVHLLDSRPLELLWRLATAPLRTLPDVYLLGEQKAGSTAVTDQLVGHPQVVGPFFPWRAGRPPLGENCGKESQYLNGFYGRRISRLGFRAFFPLRWRRPRVVFEGTPHQLLLPHSARLIHAWTPAARFIVVLREPCSRAFSQYQMYARWHAHYPVFRGWLPECAWSFEAMLALSASADAAARFAELEALPVRGGSCELPAGFGCTLHPMSLLRRGEYVSNLRRYLELFPRERFLVLRMDELDDASRDATLARVHAFLGLEPRPHAEGHGLSAVVPGGNRGRYGETMRGKTREALAAHYATHNEALKRELDIDL
jgi:hypothetical protein